jgi:hypothetical protein
MATKKNDGSDEKVIFNMWISPELKKAIKRVARQRSAALDRRVTAKDVVMSNLTKDAEVMREYGKLRTAAKKRSEQ